jgi:hypothetical protein
MSLRKRLQLAIAGVSPSNHDVEIGYKLTSMLAERIRELLPADDFSVMSTGLTIKVVGRGKCHGFTYSTAPSVVWYLPQSVDRRLERVCDVQARDLQRFVSNAKGEEWPAAGATPHVRVNGDSVKVWWGGDSESSAPAKLGQIDRRELGV